MRLIIILTLFFNTYAHAARIQFSELSRASTLENPLELEKVIGFSGSCFSGSYDEIKLLVKKMAEKYNRELGGINSFTLDQQTMNGKLHAITVRFYMNSGAEWVWNELPQCNLKKKN